MVFFTEDQEYFNSPSVYRGSTPKGGESWFTVNLYISSLILMVLLFDKLRFGISKNIRI